MNLAYIAGFVDGEGCIQFSRCRKRVFPRVLVVNTDREVLEALQDQFGGRITPLWGRKENWKPCWQWQITWSRAVRFLVGITPWLRLKLPQAQTVFAWNAIKIGPGRKRAAEIAEHDEAVALLVQRMTWLNTRGLRVGDDPIDVFLANVRHPAAA